jgi:hypothetical protein
MAVPPLGAAFGAVASAPAWMAIETATLFAELPGGDASPAFVRELPFTILAVAALFGVAAMSEECRGGIRRTARSLSMLDLRSRCILSGAAAGAVIGAIPGLFLR